MTKRTGGWIIVVTAAFVAACSTAHRPDPANDCIGSATMAADGTITLNLRAEGQRGEIGDGAVSYTRDNARYQEVLKHVDGLKPGEDKCVRPWPDK
jgi:hypothetical protein